MKKFFAAVMPHISIIASVMLTVFFVIDHFFNSYLSFMTHPYTQIVVMTLAVTSVISSFMLIAAQRREVRRINRRIDRERAKRREERAAK